MQRLTHPLRRRFGAERLDRGASAVVVGLLMVPLVALTALAIDVAAMHADRQMLQVGADAAALAVAQDCADGECSDTGATASELATANDPFGGPAAATITRLDRVEGVVTVRTDSSRQHWFAPVIGQDEAVATARWGYPTAGYGVLPYTLSSCELEWQAGATTVYGDDGRITSIEFPEDAPPVTIEFTKTSDSTCTDQSGNVVPAGFGWLDGGSGDCVGPLVEEDGWASSAPGESPPNNCDPADFSEWIGETLLIPIFDQARDTGVNAEYRILGFAAFTLLEYNFTGQFVSPNGTHLCRDAGFDPQARCLQGTFDHFVDITGDYNLDPDGARLGAGVVELTLD
jgi:Flp pilus assembly protein TadG